MSESPSRTARAARGVLLAAASVATVATAVACGEAKSPNEVTVDGVDSGAAPTATTTATTTATATATATTTTTARPYIPAPPYGQAPLDPDALEIV